MTQSQHPPDADADLPADPAAVVDALEQRVFAGREDLREASERKEPAGDAVDTGAEPPV